MDPKDLESIRSLYSYVLSQEKNYTAIKESPSATIHTLYQRRHRLDGPAVVKNTGDHEWWIRGTQFANAYAFAENVLVNERKLENVTPQMIEEFAQQAMMSNILD